MNYKEYLDSNQWKELRKKARKKAKNKCELCGGNPFNVHHVIYPKNLENDCLNNLLVVCKKCHNKLHGIKNSDLQLMKIIEKRIGWDENEIDEDGCHKYIGFDMSKTHSQEKENIKITKKNIGVLNLFEDYLNIGYISNHFDCWKGNCFWNREDIFDSGKCNWGNIEEEFSGWSSKKILFWLITKKGKYREDERDDGNTKTT